MNTALKMLRRRIVFVQDWFDDDHELPWNWVWRTGDGRFEAIACHIVNDEMEETSLGIFADERSAREALCIYTRAEYLLEWARWREGWTFG